MSDPIFWLGLSILLVALSLTAVLIVAIPAMQALARAARSVEKLADTLGRELPPTLEAIRLTGIEVSELAEDLGESARSAGGVVKQVDDSIDNAKKQVEEVNTTSRSLFTGVKVAWKTFTGKSQRKKRRLLEGSPPPKKALSSGSDPEEISNASQGETAPPVFKESNSEDRNYNSAGTLGKQKDDKGARQL